MYELPFGRDRRFLTNGGVLASIAEGWTLGGAAEYQPGALLNWGNLFFTGNLEDIQKENPEIALRPDGSSTRRRPGSTLTQGSSAIRPISQPASRSGCSHSASMAFVASIRRLCTRTSLAHSAWAAAEFQFRVDIQNLLNRQHYANPNLDPTSTNFGQIRAVNNSVMRFITFNTKLNF